MSQCGPLLLSYGGAAPSVVEGAWVAPTATLIGPVTLHPGSSVWFGAVLRADFATITIGVDSNVQDNCVFHTGNDLAVTLGDRVSVGHNAVLHGCTVGDDVLVGMGATVLNGATVGSGSLIAAGAVVLEGTDVPPVRWSPVSPERCAGRCRRRRRGGSGTTPRSTSPCPAAMPTAGADCRAE